MTDKNNYYKKYLKYKKKYFEVKPSDQIGGAESDNIVEDKNDNLKEILLDSEINLSDTPIVNEKVIEKKNNFCIIS